MKLRSIIAAALAALAAACADNNASVQWVAICAAPADECAFAETCDAQFIGRIALLPGGTDEVLWLFVQFNNNRPSTELTDVGQLNTADAYIQEYEVTYSGAAVSIPGSVYPVQSYWVPAQGSAVVSVFAWVPGTAPAAGAEVTASIVARGIYGDGSSFETAPFDVAVVFDTAWLPTCPATTSLVGTCPPTEPPTVYQSPMGIACQ